MTKAERREKLRQKKRKMRVSGASVKKLQKIKVDKTELPEKFYAK